uniref:GST N-terminal domain-containing protein n=1 Tax=Helicotheca tamesis TaxID=374047 RepID=A0A7S2HKC8_9STRA|mmetsp:Transcript_1885/g.2697  ORF Transcript_1885/g.2697 Transcript_1885/m.2697 type:complete len:453 (+) Transcript_1885:43-1401(+)
MLETNAHRFIAVVLLAFHLTSHATAFTTGVGKNNCRKSSFAGTTTATPPLSTCNKDNGNQHKTTLQMSIPNAFDTFTSGLASIARLPFGVTVSEDISTATAAAPRLLKLYDIENSKDCRTVRERITELDLEVGVVIPSASNSRVFTDPEYEYYLSEGGGGGGDGDGGQIPRLVALEKDEDEKVITGTENILSYLDGNFKNSNDPLATKEKEDVPIEAAKELLLSVGFYLPSILRYSRGEKVSSAALSTPKNTVPRPTKPLLLYSYEGNQFCRLVREVLTELDLPYTLKSSGKLSPRREELAALTGGSTQCPYLVDPNTNVQMAESKDIIAYLYKTYALWTPPNELIKLASDFIMTPIAGPLFKRISPIQAGSNREDKMEYEKELKDATKEIEKEISSSDDIVIYTYDLSPFCTEATALLDNLGLRYQKISLGYEWIPGLIKEGGSIKREALN